MSGYVLCTYYLLKHAHFSVLILYPRNLEEITLLEVSWNMLQAHGYVISFAIEIEVNLLASQRYNVASLASCQRHCDHVRVYLFRNSFLRRTAQLLDGYSAEPKLNLTYCTHTLQSQQLGFI
jgi:hypothetical protein